MRRVFTDGRPRPTDLEPTYEGFSIGKWIDEEGSGVYDVLEVETRGPFKGPRVYDSSGLPLHFDNESAFKERIFLDKKNPSILHDVITVFDQPQFRNGAMLPMVSGPHPFARLNVLSWLRHPWW